MTGLTAGSAAAGPPAALTSGQVLTAGGQLRSPNGFVRLIMQSDGNLVAYAGGAAIWNTHTSGHRGATAELQRDGNLVVRSADRRALWNAGSLVANARNVVRVTDDGRVVVLLANGSVRYSSGSRVSQLATPTAMPPGAELVGPTGERLVMQSDGNLVLYRAARAVWNSRTYAHPGAFAQLQGDGNVVVYSQARRALWNSGTAGSGPGARLVVQAGGNLAVLDRTGAPRWQSYTFANPSGAQLAGQLLARWGAGVQR